MGGKTVGEDWQHRAVVTCSAHLSHWTGGRFPPPAGRLSAGCGLSPPQPALSGCGLSYRELYRTVKATPLPRDTHSTD